MCRKCGLSVAHRGLCSTCRPEGPKRRKTHEMAAVAFLREAFPDEPLLADMSIGHTCGALRPDVLYERDTHCVAVEIDENQHSAYDATCEATRMFRIAQARGSTSFVRLNPDVFKVDGVTIRVSKKRRHEVLREEVLRRLENPPEHLLEVTYLFYDGAEIRHDVPELPPGL